MTLYERVVHLARLLREILLSWVNYRTGIPESQNLNQNQNKILLPGVCKHNRNLNPVFLSWTSEGKPRKICIDIYTNIH